MLFSSPAFFIFFAAYLALHLSLPPRYRLALVIAGSTLFYAWWNPYYAWLPFAFILIAYYGTLWMDAAQPARARNRRLVAVIVMLLLPLAIVKYSAFVYHDILGLFLGLGPRPPDWALPLGISFITFTSIAYVVDVHQGRFRVERSLPMLGGLVLFFPHLIAGPILRPAELLPQLHHPRTRTLAYATFGATLFTLGLVKKLVFADSLAESVERAFAPAAASALTAPDYLLAIYGFALQIYCDFSGYTDMALGTALLLGVKLPANFRRPYAAASVVEFWRRWHITLSRWLRDYLYVPLGGNRLGYPRQVFNLLVTMTLGGLWHGANWTFVLWGMAHGLGICAVHAVRRIRWLQPLARMPRALATILTFHFVTALWILFRAPDLATAWRVAQGPFLAPWADAGTFAAERGFALGLLAAFLVLHRWDDHQAVRRAVRKTPRSVLIPVLAIAWLVAIAVSHGSSAKFIYFDF